MELRVLKVSEVEHANTTLVRHRCYIIAATQPLDFLIKCILFLKSYTGRDLDTNKVSVLLCACQEGAMPCDPILTESVAHYGCIQIQLISYILIDLERNPLRLLALLLLVRLLKLGLRWLAEISGLKLRFNCGLLVLGQ